MRLAIFLLCPVALLVAACGSAEAPDTEQQPATAVSTTAVAGTVEPTAVCAAGSTDRFQELQKQAPYRVYCPTYLPDGFELTGASYSTLLTGAVPEEEGGPSVGLLAATFVNSATGAELEIIQGPSGIAVVASEIKFAPATTLEQVPYGDLEGSLLEPPGQIPGQPSFWVRAESAEGIFRLVRSLHARGLDASEVKRIAGNMRPLRP